MEDKINRIEEKFDSKFDAVIEKLNDINITLARNTCSLEVHEKRTDIAEKRLDIYELKLDPVVSFNKYFNFILFKIIPVTGAIILFCYKLGLLNRFISV